VIKTFAVRRTQPDVRFGRKIHLFDGFFTFGAPNFLKAMPLSQLNAFSPPFTQQ
jgi:hypothetical protein